MKKLRKILLIDDDEVNNFICWKLIQKLNISKEVKIVRNGKEGLEYILKSCKPNEACPELIILDHQMPIMDGIEFIENLKKSRLVKIDEIVILVLAVATRQADIQKYKDLGVKEFSHKPLSEKTVIEIYNKYWGKS